MRPSAAAPFSPSCDCCRLVRVHLAPLGCASSAHNAETHATIPHFTPSVGALGKVALNLPPGLYFGDDGSETRSFAEGVSAALSASTASLGPSADDDYDDSDSDDDSSIDVDAMYPKPRGPARTGVNALSEAPRAPSPVFPALPPPHAPVAAAAAAAAPEIKSAESASSASKSPETAPEIKSAESASSASKSEESAPRVHPASKPKIKRPVGRPPKHGLRKNPLTGKYCCPFEGCTFEGRKVEAIIVHRGRLHSKVALYECPVDGCYSTFFDTWHMESHMIVHDKRPGSVACSGYGCNGWGTLAEMIKHRAKCWPRRGSPCPVKRATDANHPPGCDQ